MVPTDHQVKASPDFTVMLSWWLGIGNITANASINSFSLRLHYTQFYCKNNKIYVLKLNMVLYRHLSPQEKQMKKYYQNKIHYQSSKVMKMKFTNK